MSRLVTIRSVLQQVHLVDLCCLRRCQVRLGTLVFLPSSLEELPTGFGLVVYVPPVDVEDSPRFPHKLWSPAMAAAMDTHAQQMLPLDEDAAFFQVSSISRLKVPQTPITCKPGNVEEARDLPMIRLGGTLPGRRRPMHDGAEDWIVPLGAAVRAYGVLDVWEDEITFVATTWYIHHGRRTTCRRPRDVQLSSNPVTWIEDLRHAWSDLLDRRIPFAIHVVRPRPPQFRTHGGACHVILEQGQREDYVAVVLTALMEGSPNDGIIQGAFSVRPLLTVQDVVNAMEIAIFCVSWRCTFFSAGREVPHHLQIAASSGDSLSICVESPPPVEDPVDRLHFEDLSLMQRQMQSFTFNPAASEFRPGTSCLSLQSEFVQTLYSLWIQDSFAWEQEVPATKVLTWFVDHRYPFPKCAIPRKITLFDDFAEWENHLRAAWRERILPELPLEFTVVMPQPYMMEEGVAAHVLIVQSPATEWSTTRHYVYSAFWARNKTHCCNNTRAYHVQPYCQCGECWRFVHTVGLTCNVFSLAWSAPVPIRTSVPLWDRR